ncbi:hypothetical protein PM082_014243 [Marasmius tenuissimus]|nr:hypothetical protein PM082_014243 [Marasmius tenuissimus]
MSGFRGVPCLPPAVASHRCCFASLPCFHIALASLVARQLTTLNPFSLVVPETAIVGCSGDIPPYTIVLDPYDPEGGVMSTTPTLDNRTSLVAWTVDVHPGRAVIEFRDDPGDVSPRRPTRFQFNRPSPTLLKLVTTVLRREA